MLRETKTEPIKIDDLTNNKSKFRFQFLKYCGKCSTYLFIKNSYSVILQ